jgi:hypothetical protein
MIDVEEEMVNAHKLRECDLCKLPSEPRGGVEVRAKWHCARCWINLMRRNMK